jgi:hypothetical protein
MLNRQHYHFSSTKTVAFLFPKAVMWEGILFSFNAFHTNTSAEWNSLQLFSFYYEFLIFRTGILYQFTYLALLTYN